MTSTTATKPAPTTPTTGAPSSHLYDERGAVVARQLRVQVPMLCGVWGWPATDDDPRRGVELVESPTVDQCEGCTRVLAAAVRGREVSA